MRRLSSPEFKIVPRKQKAAPSPESHVCHSPGPGPQHSLATLATSGPGVTVSCLRAGLSLSFSAASGAVSVGSVPSPLVLSHNQARGKRRHPDITLSAATKDHKPNTVLGDNSPALHSNKRKWCSIYSGRWDNWD